MQVLRSVLGWGTSKTIKTNSPGKSKAINKVPWSLPWSLFLRVYQDDQDSWAYFPAWAHSHIHAWSLLLCSSLKFRFLSEPTSSLWAQWMSDSWLKPTSLSWPNVRFLPSSPNSSPRLWALARQRTAVGPSALLSAGPEGRTWWQPPSPIELSC